MNNRWPKDLIIVCKRMAEGDSFRLRQKTHNVVTMTYAGKVKMLTFPQTPSDRRSFDNLMKTFGDICNDNWPDEKVFRGKKEIRRAVEKRRNNRKEG